MEEARRTVGGHVHAKAIHVIAEAEAARQFGNQAATKWLNGTVVTLYRRRNGRREQTFVVANYRLLGGRTKEKQSNIRSVRNGWVSQDTAPAHIVPPTTATEEDVEG